MSKDKFNLNIPNMEKFSSLTENLSDLKERVNQLQYNKHKKRLDFNAKLEREDQTQINELIAEIEKIESKENKQ